MSETATLARQDASPAGEPPASMTSFPAPITILTLVLILVWIAAFFIPSGQYQLDPSGSPIAGSFKTIVLASGLLGAAV